MSAKLVGAKVVSARFIVSFALACALSVVCAACAARAPASAPATLVVRNARVDTLDAQRSWAEAVAVRDGRFVYVGPDAGVEAWISPATHVVDARGRLILPGFHDAHVHVLAGGLELQGCNLAPARSVPELVALVTEHARAHPDAPWIVASGWDQSLFPDGAPPADFLAELGDARPILLSAGDGGHSAWANARALALAGITRDTPDPPNGRIVHTSEGQQKGQPSGLLREAAVELVAAHLPPRTHAESVAALRLGLAELARHGIVAWQEAAADEETVAAYRELEERGELRARVNLALLFPDRLSSDEEAQRLAWIRATRAALHGPHLRAGAVKLFLDGVIEGRTAALLAPYLGADGTADATLGTGLANFTPDELDRLVTLFDAEDFQVHMHAIGDRAVRMGLDAIEHARAHNGPRDARHHLAHVQLVDPADIPRFRALGVAANVQGLWAWADGYITALTEPVLGPTRSRWLYPIGSFFASGAMVVGGSDWPVTSVDPLAAIQIAVTRKSDENPDAPSWIPAERAELARMLEAYTRSGAWLEHDERDSGSIERGKRADLVLLDRDLFAIPPEEIGHARVLWTVFEGDEIYRAEGE